MKSNIHSNQSGFLLLQGLVIFLIIFLHLLVLTKILTLKIKELNITTDYLKCYYAAKTAARYVKTTNAVLPVTLTCFEMPIYIYEDDHYIYLDCTWNASKAHIMEEKP